MWELQRDMHSYIAPSVAAFAAKEPDPRHWLEVTLREQSDDDAPPVMPLGMNGLCEAIAANAITYDGTTNGGHEVYLHAWQSVPWCDEDTYLTWYG